MLFCLRHSLTALPSATAYDECVALPEARFDGGIRATARRRALANRLRYRARYHCAMTYRCRYSKFLQLPSTTLF